jgi:hypothetical protein
MRRALMLVGLIGLGVLLGFVVRLVWPHGRRLALDSYGSAESPAGQA